MLKRIVAIATVGFWALSALCYVLEMMIYGGEIDENGVVQESLFLPLTFIFLFIAIGLLIVYILLRVTRRT